MTTALLWTALALGLNLLWEVIQLPLYTIYASGDAAAIAYAVAACRGGSEWLNVSVRGSWGYADGMPTVLGIGLAPLAQWIAVPFAAIFAVRAWAQSRH